MKKIFLCLCIVLALASSVSAQWNDGPWTSRYILSQNLRLNDNVWLNIGTDSDWQLEYDETTLDSLLLTTTATNGSDDDVAMFRVRVNDGGGTLDADQEVFEIINNATELFAVDEDGDGTFKGGLTAGGNIAVGSNYIGNDGGNEGLSFDASGNGTFSGTLQTGGNTTVLKADPSVIFNTITATDTDFWVGVQEDAGGDDDDSFQIGRGTTVGTNPILEIDRVGNVTATSFAADPSGTPSLDFYDSDCTDDDINASVSADATATGTGAEVVDVSFKAQGAASAGALGEFLGWDGSEKTLTISGMAIAKPVASATCGASTEGGIYYDSDDNHFYGCNGVTWVQLDN